MTNDPRRIHEIQKKIFEKIATDDSSELQEFKRYAYKLISRINSDKFLPCNLENIEDNSSNIEYALIMTEEALKLKSVFNWDCLPSKVGVKVKTLPLDTKTQIPLKIKSLLNDEYVTSDNVKCDKEGIGITHTGHGIYGITVSDTYHYDKENNRIYHDVTEHLFSKNYFPKKSNNNLFIDGKYKRSSFNVNIPVTIHRPPVGSKKKGDVIDPKSDYNRTYDRHDSYRSFDNIELIAKFSEANYQLLLNSNNLWVKKLSYEKPVHAKKLWEKVLKGFYEVVNTIYQDNTNPVTKYDFKGLEHKMGEDELTDEEQELADLSRLYNYYKLRYQIKCLSDVADDELCRRG
jgi:hypothetical protein